MGKGRFCMFESEGLFAVEELDEEGLGEAEDFGASCLKEGQIFLALSVGGVLLEVLHAVGEF